MITDESSQNNQTVRAKVVTIRNTGGARWEVSFEGVVTRRDIHRIGRILRVEFARAQRKYSVHRKRETLLAEAKAKRELEVEATKATKVVEKPPKVTPSTIVPTKTQPTLKKVQIKETVQDA